MTFVLLFNPELISNSFHTPILTMTHDNEQYLLLAPKDVRKLAASVLNCKEIKSKGHPDVLSFLLIDGADEPARIQVYCKTATLGICRVLNEEVREIFHRKCTLRQVHEIFNQPSELTKIDPTVFNNLDIHEERQPRNSHEKSENANAASRLSLVKDEQMLDVGGTILASEFDNLMSHFKTLLRERQREEKIIEDIELSKEQQQLQQQTVLKHQRKQQIQNQQMRQTQVQIKNFEMKGTTKMQQMKKQQMRQQMRQIRK
jgi:hypothetical protein